METLEQDRLHAELAIRKANEAKAFHDFFKQERPDLNAQSNEQMIRVHHDGAPVTVESIRESVRFLEQNHAGVLHRKDLGRVLSDEQRQREQEQRAELKRRADALIAETKEREKLWSSIKNLLKVSAGMLDGEFRKYQLKDPRGNFIHPTSAMRERLQMLQATAVFRGTSTSQLKEHLRSSRPEPVTDIPPLPAQYTAIKIRLMSAADLKRLMSRYGSDSITKRLREAAQEEE